VGQRLGRVRAVLGLRHRDPLATRLTSRRALISTASSGRISRVRQLRFVSADHFRSNPRVTAMGSVSSGPSPRRGVACL
jgi:hypothetical protein